ncbi:MAG: glycosyltransferase [Fulvivirga sp.]|uniref:glycosyltransferase family 2 protein n=1 Tax=Fulvivirga sp. TaxID=1931237 RepID=UPI0032EB3972
MPVFSVIIPTFNRGKYISRAIDSVLNQTFQDFELIIINDGSTDDSDAIINSYNDSRIRYISKNNEERNIARNTGIKVSSGKWICFLDSDDYYYLNHLEKANDFIKTNKVKHWFHLNSEVRNERDQLIEIRKSVPNPAKSLIRENFLLINSLVFNRTILEKIHFLNSENAVIGEDHYLWLRLVVRFKLHHCDETTSVTVEHSNRSLKSQDFDKLKIGTTEIIESLQNDHVFMNCYGSRASWFFAFILSYLSLVANEREDNSNSWHYLKKSFQLNPKIFWSKRFLAGLKNLLINLVR